MTKAQATLEFKQHILPLIKQTYELDGVADWPARQEAWNNFTDTLQKCGHITSVQYSTWVHPTCTKGK